MKTRRHAALAVVALILLTGCASAPGAGGTVTTDPSASPPSATAPAVPTPTPTGAATPAPSHTEAPGPFIDDISPSDGACSQVVSTRVLDDVLGSDRITRDEQLVDYGLPRADMDSFSRLGGIDCRWYGNGHPTGLGVTLLPPDVVPAAFAEEYSGVKCPPIDLTLMVCRLAAVVNGTWVMVTVESVWESPETAMRSWFEAVATDVSPPDIRTVERQQDWWTAPDCASLGQEMQLDEVLSAGYVNGTSDRPEKPEFALLRQAGIEFRCHWSSSREVLGSSPLDYRIADVVFGAGAAQDWADLKAAPGARTVQVEGADEAVFIWFANGGEGYLFATEGVNVLRAVGNVEFSVDIAERALAALAD